MKKLILLGTALFFLFVLSSVAQSTVTVTVEKLTETNQGILPMSGKTGIFKVGVKSDQPGTETFTSCSVSFLSYYGFSAGTDLLTIGNYTVGTAGNFGLTLYQNSTYNQVLADAIFDDSDSAYACNLGGSYTLTLSPALTLAQDVQYTFFVVIKTSDDIQSIYYTGTDHRDRFKTISGTVVAGGVGQGAGVETDLITCESRVVDLIPIRSDINLLTNANNIYYPGNSAFDSDRYKWFIPEEMEEPNTDYVYSDDFPKSQLLPIFTYTPVLGIDCAAPAGCKTSDYNIEYLESVTATFTDSPYAGTHDGADDAATLTDSTASWTSGAFVGKTVRNTIDGSSGTITANTPTMVTAILAGGDDDDWDIDDTYIIIPNFDPTTAIYDVTLWKDANGDGIWQETDTKVIVSYGAWIGSGPWIIKLTTSTDDSNRNIEPTVDNKVDYFIVIRTHPEDATDPKKIQYGADFKVSIEPGGVVFEAAKPDEGLSRKEADVKEIIANLEMHSYTGDYIDATSSPIPVIGINSCDGPGFTDNLQRIKVTLLGLGGKFHPSDLADLVADDSISGVSLWLDNKGEGNIGTFDPQRSRKDTLIPLNDAELKWYNSNDDSEWSAVNDIGPDYYTFLRPQDAILLLDDDAYTGNNRGDDYFVCIRTSGIPYNGTRGIDYLDEIQVRIDDGDIEFGSQNSSSNSALTTGTLTANVPTFLTDLTDEGVSIPADATDPIIGLNLVKPAGENVYLASLVIQILDNSFALSSLKDLSTDATTSGIAVYKDDGDGIFGETVDTPVPLAATPALISSPAEDFLRIQLVLETPQDIPENDTGDDEGDDYFVIIRTSSESSVEGDIFAMWGSKVQEIRSRALGFVSDSTPVDGIVDAIPFSDTINADDTTWNNDGSGGDYNNWTMVFTSGLLEGNAYYITEVTADTITCDGANFNDVVATDEFTIYKIDSRTYERLEPTVVTYTLSVSSDPDSCEPADGDHYYLPGSSVTCSVTSPTAGVGGTRYVCTGYTLDETTVSDTSVDITMNADHTLAWIWKTQYQLTTAVSPTGGGTVTPDIESADGWYDEDTVVTLTAAPGIDYVFSSWSGDLTGDGSPAILTMDAAKAVTANFIQDGHTLEVTSAYDTPDPGVGVHGYADGTPVTCTLGESTVDGTPGTQYVYTGWNGTGSFVSPATGTDTEVIRTIHEDSTIIWNWKTQHELTASVAAGAGTIEDKDENDITGITWQDAGDVTITAVPDVSAGYVFDHWGGDLAGSTDNPVTFDMNQPKNITAHFVDGWKLEVISDYGSPTPTVGIHTYAEDPVETVTCSVESPVAAIEAGKQYVCTGYTLDGFTVNIAASPYSVDVIMGSDHILTWNWQTQYELTGAVSPEDAGTIEDGDENGITEEPTWEDEGDVSITAVPADGYSFSSWTGDVVSSDNPVTFDMDGPKNVTANFTKNPLGGTVESLTIENQGILPLSGKTGIFKIGVSSSGDGDSFAGCSISFDNVDSGFSAATDLLNMSAAPYTYNSGNAGDYGLTLYQESEPTGENPVFSASDYAYPCTVSGGGNSYTLTLSPAISLATDVQYYFYVVIKTSDNISGEYYEGEGEDYRDKFTTKCSVVDENGEVISADANIITCESRVVDLVPWRSDTNIYTNASNTYYPGNGTFDEGRYKWFIPEEKEEPTVDYWSPAPKSQLLSIYTYTAVLGIDCAAPRGCYSGSSNTEYLSNVTVTFTDTGTANFDPTTDIYDVTLWEDVDGDGIFDFSLDSQISSGYSGDWTVTLHPSSPEAIDSTINNIVDYFVVIRTEPHSQAEERKIAYGADFKVSIEPGGVVFEAAKPDEGLSRKEANVKEIIANLEMHDYAGLYIDATSSPIPVIGINACDGPDYTDTLQYVKVTFLGPGSGVPVPFCPSDLAGLVTDDEISGVSLWRDNKEEGNIGTFDPQRSRRDTFIPLSQSDLLWYKPDGNEWSSGDPEQDYYYTILRPQTAIQLLNDDTYTDSDRGDDYFVCIRTSSNIPYDGTRGIDYLNQIQIRINDGDIQFGSQISTPGSALETGELTANVPTFLTDLTLSGTEIPEESSATPVIGINLVKPSAATDVYFASLVVQILDKGTENFDIKDLKDLLADAGTSGIAVYKDHPTLGTNGVFDENDIEVGLVATPALISSATEGFLRIQLVPDIPQEIPEDDIGDNSGDDYFLVIRTSGNMVEGDTFSIRLWGSNIKQIASRALGFATDVTTIDGTVDAGGVSGNTITSASQDWSTSTNWTMVFTSGAAEGKAYYITGVTTTTLTCAGVNFAAEGVANGDSFTLYKIDSRTYERLETNTLTASARRIDVTSPSLVKDPARNNTYIITWINRDLPSGSTISIYYDTDNNPADGLTLIVSGRSSADGAQSYTWDTTDIDEGEHYYIYIVAEDAGSDYITSSYSSGNVWVKDDSAPSKAIVSEPSSNIIFDGCTDTFVDGDGTTTTGAGEAEDISIGTALTSFKIKIADSVYWYDADGSNTWTDGDALWIDKNNDGRYDSGDSLIVGPAPIDSTTGTILTDDYHFVYDDTNKDAGYDSGEDIYYEGGEGNHYNYYSGSPSDYKVVIGYDVADPEASATITLLADENTNPDDEFALTITTFPLTETEKIDTYLWDISELPSGFYYVCVKVDDGFNYPLYGYSTGKVGINGYPYIKISTPSSDTWTWAGTYTISWTDSDPDDNALISLYYDEDTIWDNGNETLINTTDTITEDSATDSYTWDISSIPNGSYYLVAKIDDGANDPYCSYSKGKLTIMDSPSVTLEAVGSYAGVTLNWIDNTPDVDDKTIEIYRKDGRWVNTEFEAWSGEIKIATISVSPSDTYSYVDTSLELGVIGGYWVLITCPSLGSFWLSNSSTSTINPLEAQRLAYPNDGTPDGLETIPSANVITLQWTDNSDDEDSFEIERKLASEGIDKYVIIATVPTNSTSYADFDVTADVTYSYRVRARKYYALTGNYGYSKYSGEATGSSYTFDDNLNIGEGGGGGGGCFIATAAYGTEMSEEVITLKKFRDDVLLKTSAGRNFVKLYYVTSPPIADFIRNKPLLKAMVRLGLKPLVWWSKCHCETEIATPPDGGSQ